MCFVYCLYMTGPYIFDYIKRLIQLTVIPLSGGHCILKTKNVKSYINVAPFGAGSQTQIYLRGTFQRKIQLNGKKIHQESILLNFIFLCFLIFVVKFECCNIRKYCLYFKMAKLNCKKRKKSSFWLLDTFNFTQFSSNIYIFFQITDLVSFWDENVPRRTACSRPLI